VGLIVMRQLSLCLGICGILAFGSLHLAAQNGTFTKGNVTGSWTDYSSSGALPPGVACPGGGASCGFAAQPYDGSYSSLAPSTGSASDGWHSYDPNMTYPGTGSNAQNYLNSLVICTTTCSSSTLSFSLGGIASLNIGPFGNTPVNKFRAPTGDSGYFLSAPGPATITISAPSGYYFNAFDFYWGSVDPWNAVTFIPSSGSAVTVYGTDVCDTASGTCFPFSDPNHTTGTSTPNTDSATIDFTPVSGTPTWSSVTFNACSDPAGPLGGACYPAFEFDNLQFTLTTATSSAFVPGGSFAPTPEPSSMLLLGTGIAGLAILLRRKFPR
jgi:PEP-CTERM motif